MSADHWAICPRCITDAREKAEAEREAVMALYGTVPVAEFEAKREALNEVDPEQFRTFREDYEFWGAEDGEVHADYSGQCMTCGLSAKLEACKQFWTVDSPPAAMGEPDPTNQPS